MANILIINGSMRKNGNCHIIEKSVIQGIKKIKGIKIQEFVFAGKNFSGCRAECVSYCMKNGQCCIKDGLQELWELFLWADGIVWIVPVYHVGVPGQVKCAMDRLCNMQYSYFQGQYPRWNKVWGAIVQGSSRWGGQEFTIQWLIESALLMKCLPVTGDAPGSYFGVAGYAPTWEKESIREDKMALELSENMGQRVAETTKIVKYGIDCLREELDQRYFPEECMKQRKHMSLEISNDWQRKGEKTQKSSGNEAQKNSLAKNNFCTYEPV